MNAVYLILYVLAAVLFLFAGVLGWGWRARDGAAPRFGGWSNLVAFGLLCWVLVPLIMKAKSM
jgi:hypothetical protein